MEQVRSAHKAATRDGLALVAARLALTGQLDTKSLTRTAGVSVRTFHNYFNHLDAAVEYYIKYCIIGFVAQLEAGKTLEQAAIATDDTLNLHYVAQGLLHKQWRKPVVDCVCQQYGISTFVAEVLTAVAGATIQVVLENCDEKPSAELIHSAFGTNLKGIGDDCAIRKSP